MTKEQKQYEKMTQMNIPKLITLLAIPTVISMLVTALYNFGDTYFVSKIGDTSATAAVSVVFPLMAIIQAVGFMIGMGAGSIISRLLGSKKEKEANKIAITALISAILFGFVVIIFGNIFLNPLMDLLGASSTSKPYAIAYARYIIFATPVMSGAFVLNNVLRAEGKAKLSMIGLTIGGILNLGLDPLFIFTFKMGIYGAAIATAISQLISFTILLSFYLRKKTIVSLSIKNISKDKKDYSNILSTGAPTFLRQGLAAIAAILLNHFSKKYGFDPGTAAMGVVSKIFQVIFMIVLGIGQGYQPVAGYNYSAKKYKRVKQSFFYMFIVSTVIMTIGSLFIFLFSKQLMNIFVENDPEAVRIGIEAIKWQSIGMPLCVLGVACNMSFQSLGKRIRAVIVSCMRQGIFFIPLIVILPTKFEMKGVAMTPGLADVLTFFATVPFAISFILEINKKMKNEEIVKNE